MKASEVSEILGRQLRRLSGGPDERILADSYVMAELSYAILCAEEQAAEPDPKYRRMSPFSPTRIHASVNMK